MDSLTQIVLGAAVGYAVSGKKLGNKALLYGAIAGTFPDLDFIPTLPFQDEFVYLTYHRGITHSILFCLLAPKPFSWLTKKIDRKIPTGSLSWLFFWAFATHMILDCFTTWGTQTLWPLPHRTAWNTIFIIDPLYTLPLIFSLIIMLFFKSYFKKQKVITIGLLISSIYLTWTVGTKFYINTKFEDLFKHHNLNVIRYTTRPTLLNTILWSTTAETKEGYYVGMISLLDKSFPKKLYFIQKNHALSNPFSDPETQALIGYTKGYYAVEKTTKGIVIHDLRYGFLGDPWLNGKNFVFSYFLEKLPNNKTKLTIKNPDRANTSVLLPQVWTRLKGLSADQ